MDIQPAAQPCDSGATVAPPAHGKSVAIANNDHTDVLPPSGPHHSLDRHNYLDGEISIQSTDDSQSIYANSISPPTSQEYPLSQDSQLSQLSLLAATRIPLSNGNAPRSVRDVAAIAGQKRTIEGYRKTSDSSSGSSTVDTTHEHGHARNISAVSTTSSTTSARDLALDLKTRLTYAMVKVAKGWESYPIEEVESLASHMGSPPSSNSTTQGLGSAAKSPEKLTQKSQDTSPLAEHDADSTSRRTYESFWAGQNRTTPITMSSPRMSDNLRFSDNRAQLSTQYAHVHELSRSPRGAPALRTQTSDSTNSQWSTYTPTLLTPGRARQSESFMSTPAQKSLQEQDAIETLMAMGSPGGATKHVFPQQSPASQPLQPRESPGNTFYTSSVPLNLPRRVEFSGIPPLSEHSDDRKRMKPVQRRRTDELGQFLGVQHPEESSDDEIEIPLTSRRVTKMGGQM